MPEVGGYFIRSKSSQLTRCRLGEVARIVHYLRKHLVNRTIKSCQGFEDDIVYGKVGTSATAFQKALEGKKVTAAGQQGKYFYVTFDGPPHSVMHLGMSGWIKFSAEETGYYKKAQESKVVEEWPPKYMKFLLKCEAETIDGEDRDPVEVAFIDARRLGRIRLVDCAAEDIRKTSPLKENGPDPIIDKDVVTVEWLTALMRRKKVPVKALLLDQANLSGVGNWVADEVLYQAKIHPEQYSNTFGDEEIQRLHDSLIEVCTIACETLADSTKFPETWLMKYRWNKGKKDSNVLPNGEKIIHLKVGGRTSAVVPSVQKKTGAVAGDTKAADVAEDEDEKPAKGRKRKSRAAEGEDNEDHEDEEVMPAKKDRAAVKQTMNGKKAKTTDTEDAEPVEDGGSKAAKGRGKTSAAKAGKPKTPQKDEPQPATPGSRKSARTKAK